ncbi:hypothetical protein CQ13_15315 [Bradyrhizobium retamae]|uniref:Uncharacterized protein n=1 Tax=Bradyrhizobium retamae TaxID=1300035 RepID=A0A0R3NIQ2_9BRAD|nr:hypothetical protein CQ13_15315 [Bradyrhizobium retamae]
MVKAARDQEEIAQCLGWGARIRRALRKANSAVSYVIGLPILTMLGGLLVGYYQYLNAYQEKISARAENDVKAATAAFTEISKKFSQVQMLQQALFINISNALDENVSPDEQVMAAKHAKSISTTYEKAWVTLLENGDVMARSAEIDIDWATDFKRDQITSHYPNSDPLSRTLLAAYDFDCNDNLPKVAPVIREQPPDACEVDGSRHFGIHDFSINVCPKRRISTGSGSSVRVHWYSAKHQVVTMHYCLQVLHQRLAKVRSWALHGEPSPAAAVAFRAERDQLRKEIDVQAARLEAFMGLALFHIEAVRVKYRPVSFACHLPFATPIISRWNDSCTPVQTTPYEGLRTPDSTPSKTPSNAASKQVSAAVPR